MRRILRIVTVVVAASSCELPPAESNRDAASPDHGIALVIGDSASPVGARIAVQVRLHLSSQVMGIQGTLGFDPARLRYVGQPGPEAPFVIVNAEAAERGQLRMASLAMPHLGEEAGTLVFEVRAAGYRQGLRYQLDYAGEADGRPVTGPVPFLGVGVAPVLRPVTGARWLTIGDWIAALGPAMPPGSGPSRAPGSGLTYGDVTLDGLLNIVDAYGAANLGVGNLPLITDATKDYVVAANVFPFNLPGLGEASDLSPPGVEADGSRLVTILDAVAIANDAVGNDQPIVREAIPGREAAAFRTVLAGTLTANRTLTRDTVYELHGVVKVSGGVTLTITAGTRIEGDPGTRGSSAKSYA